MKRTFLTALVLSFSGLINAQEPGVRSASSPPPLPPGPWLKRAPAPCQWVVSYTGKSKEPAQPKASPSQTPVDPSARKTVAVIKTANLLVEVTTRQSGSVVSRWNASGLVLTQVGSGGNWFASAGGSENGFNETDYTKSDFPGFDWISEKNYVGVKAVGSQQYLVFHDKVVTMDPRDIAPLQAEAQQSMNNWLIKQEERKSNRTSTAPVNQEEAPPPKFNIDDYKMEAVAMIDSATGLPVMLTYGTTTGNETRTYQFYPAPAVPPSLPPAAKQIVAEQQARLNRLSRPAAIP